MYKSFIYLCTTGLLALAQGQDVGRCTEHLRKFDLCANDGAWTVNKLHHLSYMLNTFSDNIGFITHWRNEGCASGLGTNKWKCCYKTWDGSNLDINSKRELLDSVGDIKSVIGNVREGTYLPSWVERWNGKTQLWCNYNNMPFSYKWKCQGRS
ncbi:hypothetical protein BX616_004415 [Lobosporangium transversale]|uniref:Cyanovirin-N domain-containing protein n=1 Tax=Lobosporangium transversale TaxID=64571 RepID=A0A1Y2GN60_9FUNG|nr:hypothetical protein BCR41DRAFT_61910 [Lobosporangium transversale]KAF9918906.1 hypothetical protein BX616_004415 [Lobosporangium transversale]ORZ16180.1 hypothetical protein BCR41DRAFT_61910 [Lobosporangium transversale]|eukprot:XP_021881527.1 hypothetical protein BCR41DRAFT_61910 [Lobosporangium transversale]